MKCVPLLLSSVEPLLKFRPGIIDYKTVNHKRGEEKRDGGGRAEGGRGREGVTNEGKVMNEKEICEDNE